MNQDQRKYLIELVTKTCKRQIDELKTNMPSKPSLNNYLVAACLDGSIQLQDVEGLKKKIRERVIKFGKEDRLVKEKDTWSRQAENEVTLPAEDIFIFPEAYIQALQSYKEKRDEINSKVNILESQKDTIILKIQIGSAQALSKLVMEVDNMADLSIMNSQLMLAAGEQTKIEEKSKTKK